MVSGACGGPQDDVEEARLSPSRWYKRDYIAIVRMMVKRSISSSSGPCRIGHAIATRKVEERPYHHHQDDRGED